jgi:hypothetical protein
VVATTALVVGAAIPAEAQTYWGTIGNYHSGKCLDDTNGYSGNGNQQQIWTCLYNLNQEWTFYNASGNTVLIQNEKSFKCLDMLGGSSANGTHVVIWGCNSSDDAQRWYLIPTDIAHWYLFKNLASGTCMTVSADSQSNGAKVQGWHCTSNVGGDHAYYWEPHYPGL